VKIHHIAFTITALLLLYHSFYFEPLDRVKENARRGEFDPAAYARDFWDNKLPAKLPEAVDAAALIALFRSDMKTAVSRYSRTLGVSETHAYLVQGSGRILSVSREAVMLALVNTPEFKVKLTMDLIFGNAIRDASGLINVSDFPSTMMFNTVSSKINTIVNQEVIPPFRTKAEKGAVVRFFAACEVHEEADADDMNPLETIPIQLQIIQE
jgi:predicted lipoprotein